MGAKEIEAFLTVDNTESHRRLAASETEMVTVALRRADLTGKKDPFANILEFIDPKRFDSNVMLVAWV